MKGNEQKCLGDTFDILTNRFLFMMVNIKHIFELKVNNFQTYFKLPY